MTTKKQTATGTILLFAILLINFSSAQSTYGIANPQLVAPGIPFGVSSMGAFPAFNSNQCQAGQDFIVQIAPFGCNPIVVRSDLLEEQNVPIYCQLYASKLNPLISVNAVDFISFTGSYPKGVAGVGFYPAQAALKSTGTSAINSPAFNNIGYAVIVLNQNQNESSMPDFISGNLTANIRYDIQNAFGVGQATQYLPQLSNSDWSNKFAQYSFWNGKGFLRAEKIDSDSAIVSIYSDQTNKISTIALQKGQTSSQIYMPGFYCQAGLALRLDDLQNPSTRARLNINGEIAEVAEGDQFLNNKCSLRTMGAKGISQRVQIRCATDNGYQTADLIVNPAINIQLTYKDSSQQTVSENKTVNLGDKIFTTSNNKNSVYLAYAGTKGDTKNIDDLFAYLQSMPQNKDSLTEDDLASAKFLVESLIGSRITGVGVVDWGGNALRTTYFGLTNLAKQNIIDRKKVYRLEYNTGGKASQPQDVLRLTQDVLGVNVRIIGFANPADQPILDSTTKMHYQSAMADYRQVVNNFANEVDPDLQILFGKKALIQAIDLASKSLQNKNAYELCQEFSSKYPTAKSEVLTYCNNYKFATKDSSIANFVIGGQVKVISLENIYEPPAEDYSATINIKQQDGTIAPYTLRKDEIVSLNENPQFTFQVKVPGVSSPNAKYIYFGFSGGKWKWSLDKASWADLSETKFKTSNSALNGIQLNKESVNYLLQLQDKNYNEGSTLLANSLGATKQADSDGNDYIQLKDLGDNAAKILAHVGGTSLGSDTLTLRKNVQSSKGNYVFTLADVKLNRVAKVSIIPNINNAGTQANFSFNIGIEKRGIQLSPDQIQKKIDILNKSIDDWEGNSQKLGEVVKGFNAACLAVGTTLTIKDLFQNFDGKAIARQEVMRSPNGWMNICKGQVDAKKFSTIDACLLANSDKIESDVSSVENIIKNQEGITSENLNKKLIDLRNSLGDKAANPDNPNQFVNTSQGSNAYAAFSNASSGKISLSQARDLDRIQQILNSNPTDELRKIAEGEMYKILSDVNANSDNLAATQSIAGKYKISANQINVVESGKNAKQLPYGGLNYGNIKDQTPISELKDEDAVAFIQTTAGLNFIAALDSSTGTDILPIKRGGSGPLLYYANNGSLATNPPSELQTIYFKKFDRTTYQNKFKIPQVQYFETEPYKGLPAIVPFDTKNGWYAATKQLIPGAAASLATSKGGLRAYDESGKPNSFYICNVGKNGNQEFNSGIGDDICQNFNPINSQVQGEFPGLNSGETASLAQKATKAINDAATQRQTNPSLREAHILGERIQVGQPATGLPEIQCQDFMSPQECNLLFNACDPVVCPVSRCNLGGTYSVPDVVQSGVVGSLALCLPNAREGIAVPICLSGVKAGVDSLISVEKNYRDCLQTNLQTGKTVGICDEIHSVYLCDFFWSQTQPIAKLVVPKIFETITGQTGRGGGEYLGVKTAWDNAGKSVDYMTNYYGAASFEAFKTGVIKEIGSAVCRSFVSAAYPSNMKLFDSLIQPQSPPQYTAWFSESTYSTATVPATSSYKVFYHIYAGQNNGRGTTNSGAFYNVYLKSPSGTSFYQFSNTLPVASGFIAPGDYASQTKDFTAPSGYQQLCINVNAKETCGFNRVTTDFGLNYVQDLYAKEQAGQTNISSETDCVAGTPSLYSFANPNIQEGLENYINPTSSATQIVRVCSTDNPGKSTDPSHWVQVGTCDNGKGTLKCYMDTNSVKNAIKSSQLRNETIQNVTDTSLENLRKQGQYFQDFKGEVAKIEKMSALGKINYITPELFAKAFLNKEKAKLLMLRAGAYAELAVARLGVVIGGVPGEKIDCNILEGCETPRVDLETCNSDSSCRKLVGNKIIESARAIKSSLKIQGISDIDESIRNEGVAQNFECLMLQIALQESAIKQCKQRDLNGNPFYCDGDATKTFPASTPGEKSYGAFQINIKEHPEAHPEKFEDGVKYAANLLVQGYIQRNGGRVFSCGTDSTNPACSEPNAESTLCTGTAYSGWSAAIRGYNGWGCGGNNNYVENVIAKQTDIQSLFSEVCGSVLKSSEPSSQASSINKVSQPEAGTISSLMSHILAVKGDSTLGLSQSVYYGYSESGKWYWTSKSPDSSLKGDWNPVDGGTVSLAGTTFLDENRKTINSLGAKDYQTGLEVIMALSGKTGSSVSNLKGNVEFSNEVFTIRQSNKVDAYVKYDAQWSWGYKDSGGSIKWFGLGEGDSQRAIISSETQPLFDSLSSKSDFYSGAEIILDLGGVATSITTEKGTTLAKNSCVTNAFWANKNFEKIDTSKSVSPGAVYISLGQIDLGACSGYSVSIYTESLGSEKKFEINTQNVKQIKMSNGKTEYYFPYSVDLNKKSVVQYSPNNYNFVISDLSDRTVFQGEKLTVKSWYSF